MHLLDILKRDLYTFRIGLRKNMVPVRGIKGIIRDYGSKQKALIDEFYSELPSFTADEEDIRPDVELKNYTILSFNGDRMGKVISYNGGIYRVIYKESVPAFKKLWKTGVLQLLGEKGMIPKTEITRFYTEEYPIIISHEKVTMSPSSLWNDDMILDALLLICLIKEIVQRSGFTLHDGHLNNVTFHEGRPVFTDIGSIVENKGQPTICDREILFTGCYRLLSRRIGNSILKHIQLYDESNNMIWIGERSYNDMVREYGALLGAFLRYHFFHSGIVTFWTACLLFKAYDVRAAYIYALFHHDDLLKDESHGSGGDHEEDLDLVADAIASFDDISDIVEVSGSEGRAASYLFRKTGISVHTLEADEKSAEKAYERFRKEQIPANVYCFNYLYGTDDKILASVRAGLVIASDVSNSCVSYQNYRIDSVLNSLSKLTTGYVACTFYPLRKTREKFRSGSDDPESRISEFENAFGLFFETEKKREIGRAGSEDHHILYIGRKKHEYI